MARITDPQKIEDVRRAAMEFIVEFGYRGMSISDIAKKASVSVGYLYRYYKSKEDLFEDLINTVLAEVIEDLTRIEERSKTIKEIVTNLTATLFKLGKEDPVRARLLTTLVLDSDIEQITQGYEINKGNSIERIIDLGRRTGEIGDNINKDEVLLVLLTIPFRYVFLKVKENNQECFFSDEQVVNISNICCNALK